VSALTLTVRGAFYYSETTADARRHIPGNLSATSCQFNQGQLSLMRR